MGGEWLYHAAQIGKTWQTERALKIGLCPPASNSWGGRRRAPLTQALLLDLASSSKSLFPWSPPLALPQSAPGLSTESEWYTTVSDPGSKGPSSEVDCLTFTLNTGAQYQKTMLTLASIYLIFKWKRVIRMLLRCWKHIDNCLRELVQGSNVTARVKWLSLPGTE